MLKNFHDTSDKEQTKWRDIFSTIYCKSITIKQISLASGIDTDQWKRMDSKTKDIYVHIKGIFEIKRNY